MSNSNEKHSESEERDWFLHSIIVGSHNDSCHCCHFHTSRLAVFCILNILNTHGFSHVYSVSGV